VLAPVTHINSIIAAGNPAEQTGSVTLRLKRSAEGKLEFRAAYAAGPLILRREFPMRMVKTLGDSLIQIQIENIAFVSMNTRSRLLAAGNTNFFSGSNEQTHDLQE